MYEVQNQCAPSREWREEGDHERIENSQDKFKIRRSEMKYISRDVRQGGLTTHLNKSMLCKKIVSFRKYLFMRSCWESAGDLAVPSLIVETEAKEDAERRLVFVLPVMSSSSVSVSVSVNNSSVSVALSPSVAEGVVRSADTIDDTELCRICDTDA